MRKTYLNKEFVRKYILHFFASKIASAKLSKKPFWQLMYDILKNLFLNVTYHLASIKDRRFSILKLKLILFSIFICSMASWVYILVSFNNTTFFSLQQTQGPVVASSLESDKRLGNYALSKISELPLKARYRLLASEYYSESATKYLPVIDKVLSEKGLVDDELFIKGMFYVGEHESHWNPNRVSSINIKGGHPTGIFQFLPGTFMSVSDRDIFNPEDQVRAFVTMWERGRCDEFEVVFVCGWKPCLESEVKNYLLKK